METVAKKETYQELKARQAKELNSFKGIFFAFNNEQFEEGLVKVGLTLSDEDKIYPIGSGGFVCRDRSKALHSLNSKLHEELVQFKRGEESLVKAIAYELANHEYCITGDIADALKSLDIDRQSLDPRILKKAIIKHNENRDY